MVSASKIGSPLVTSPRGDSALGHLVFTLVLGVLGWAAILAATYFPELAPVQPPVGRLAFVLFLGVIVAARAMAARLSTDSVLSLDSGFYVAAAVCLGSVSAGRLVGLALTLDSLFRLFGRDRHKAHGERPVAGGLAYVLYFGGMTGALIMLSGWLFSVDSLRPHEVSEMSILWHVCAVGFSLMITHYAIQGIRLKLLGRRLRSYIRELAIPGLISEASLMPLAVVVVFIYSPDRPVTFALLGATYLVVNFVFNRLTRASGELRLRVAELVTLNSTARRLAASLQLQELVETVARETCAAIPNAERFSLTLRGGGKLADQLFVDYYVAETGKFERFAIEQGLGATAQVLRKGKSLYIADAEESDIVIVGEATAGVRCWYGVPITMYGVVEGVLTVQCTSPHAFAAEQRELVEAIAMQAAAALQNARLYEMAMVDGLTQLFVRRYFDTRLDEEIERARRYETEFSMVMMDIDNFKKLNDTHGHVVGDRVLKGVAAIVKSEMRGVDTAARYGGEEIAMILPRTELIAAYAQAERIRSKIADMVVPVDDEKTVNVTASFGIAAFPESGATDAEDLVRRADRALYRAKKTGKNRVELFWVDPDKNSARPSIRTA